MTFHDVHRFQPARAKIFFKNFQKIFPRFFLVEGRGTIDFRVHGAESDGDF